MTEQLNDIPEVTGINHEALTADDLLSEDLYETILSIEDPIQRNRELSLCGIKAAELKIKRAFTKGYKECLKKILDYQRKSGIVGNKTYFYDQPIILNCGSWECDDDGVRYEKQNSEGDVKIESASPIPILPTEIITNISTNTEKVKLGFYKGNCWRSVTADRAKVSSSNSIVELSNNGIEVTSESAKFLVRYISDLINLNQGVIPQAKGASQMGWVGGNKTFIPYADKIGYDGDDSFKNLYQSVSSIGDPEGWEALTKSLREKLFVRLAMAASFASPIIELLDTLPFIFHMYGGTGTGKTVSLMVAASIWGNPKTGNLINSLNMTQNHMLSTAAFLKNLPFFGDELQTVKTIWDNYDKFIMTFCNGINRGRNHYDKTLPSLTWKCSMLTTGEEPIIKRNSGGGAVNRVIEVYCDKKLFDDGNAVCNFINSNYGTAGSNFIEKLIEVGRGEIQFIYSGYYGEIMKKCGTTEKQAAAMAIMLTADRIASELFYPGELPLRVEEIQPYLVSEREVDISERAYDYTVNLIARNQKKFEEPENGETWGKFENDIAYINKDVLIRELNSEGYDFNAVKKRWAENGHIELSNTGRYHSNTSCNKIKADYVKFLLPAEKSVIDTSKPAFTE